MNQPANNLTPSVRFFAGEPEFVHQSEQGLIPLLSPIKGYPPNSPSVEIAGSGVYLDLVVAPIVALLLIGSIIVVPLMAMKIRDKSKRFGIITVSLVFAFIISSLVLINALSINRSLILLFDTLFILLLIVILGALSFVYRKAAKK